MGEDREALARARPAVWAGSHSGLQSTDRADGCDVSEARTRRELVELLSLRSNSRRRIVGEQHKLKDGALGFVRCNPQPAIMGLNDRTADRQTHPHTVRFCREQRIEYPLEILRADEVDTSGAALAQKARPL